MKIYTVAALLFSVALGAQTPNVANVPAARLDAPKPDCHAWTIYPDGHKVCGEQRAVDYMHASSDNDGLYEGGVKVSSGEDGGGCMKNADGSESCYRLKLPTDIPKLVDPKEAVQMPLVVPKPVGKQVKPPIVKPIQKSDDASIFNCDEHADKCITWSSTPVIDSPVIWMHGVKDGVYTMTFTDSQNHWRCFISNMKDDSPQNLLYSRISSLTIICYDPSAPSNVPNESKPTPSKAAGK